MNARETDALFTMTAGTFRRDCYRELYADGKTYWVPVGARAEFERKLQAVSILGGWLSLVPRLRADRHFSDRSAVVWARVESGAAAAALAAFEPQPTLILRDGETLRRTALWWLSVELTRIHLLKANDRLAYVLGGVQAATWPEGWIVPPGPGTRTEVELLTDALYHPNDVVGDGRPDGALADRPPRRRFQRRSHSELPAAVAA